MTKAISLFLSLILALPAFGQALPQPAQALAAPVCGEIGGEFEQIVREFSKNWSGEPDFCEFKRFTALNEMITEDMRHAPERYVQRMNFLKSQKDAKPEAINYLLLSLQETWFNTYIDAIILREEGRSGAWSRWLTIGAAGTVIGLLALPFTKKYSSKPIRLFQTGLKHFLQKRALTFGSTSVTTQLDHFRPEVGRQAPQTFVAPPLFFAGDEEILDNRTYKIFLTEIQNDVISATTGVLGGWFIGHGASVIVRDYVAKSWSETAFGRFKWAVSKPALFASPGMIAGFAVTVAATNGVSDFSSDYLFQKRFKEIRSNLGVELHALAQALVKGDDFMTYTKGEKLKNDLALQNFVLTRELTEEIAAEAESTSETILHRFSYCMEHREKILVEMKKRFAKNIALAVKLHGRNVKAALVLAQDAQAVFLRQPHALTRNLTGANDKLMMRTTWLLDPAQTAGDLWMDIEKAVNNQPVECVDLQPGIPL